MKTTLSGLVIGVISLLFVDSVSAACIIYATCTVNTVSSTAGYDRSLPSNPVYSTSSTSNSIISSGNVDLLDGDTYWRYSCYMKGWDGSSFGGAYGGVSFYSKSNGGMEIGGLPSSTPITDVPVVFVSEIPATGDCNYDPDSCSDERESLVTLCGSANYYIDEETCAGECSCDPDKLYEDLQTCEEGQLADVDYDKCTVTCDECSDEKAALEAKCGAAGVTGVGPGGCGGRCRNCSDYWKDAANDCSTRGGVVDGFCHDEGGKIDNRLDWKCKTELPNEPPPEPEKAETPPEKNPEKESKPDAPADDPNNPALDENRNKWLEAIKGNLDERIQQGNEEQEFLANIAENAKRMTDNQSILAKGLDGIASAVKKLDSTVANSGNSGTEVNLDNSGIETRLDGIGDKLEELKPGTDYSDITASDFGEAYSLDEEFDVSDRFSTFVDTIKTTGLFSVPNQFFGSLPSGGSSVIHIDAGQYGDHSVDLNDTLGPGLLVLRSIFVIIFGFLSIRAVVMKR